MSNAVVEAVERLRAVECRLDRGLSDEEVALVQSRLAFTFGPEHREFIQSVMPVGKGWPNWRNGDDEDLAAWLDGPVEGVVFDVHNIGFWPASWGERPGEKDDREHVARVQLARVPRLVPVYAHRYLPSDTRFIPSPVFSIHQTDVIFYGDNLLDYVAHEFHVLPRNPADRTHVPFWSDLALNAENSDL